MPREMSRRSRQTVTLPIRQIGSYAYAGPGTQRGSLSSRKMSRRATHSGLSVAILVVSLLLVSCADGSVRDAPPPVTVRYGDRSLDLRAWTYCFGNVCADGFPPAPPPDVGSPQAVVIEFPRDGWSFTATFVPAANECVRAERVRLDPTPDGRFVLMPVGEADTYDVTLFGKGDGDLVVTFRWTTPRDGAPGDIRSVSHPCQSEVS
jgi:hypothetical protein